MSFAKAFGASAASDCAHTSGKPFRSTLACVMFTWAALLGWAGISSAAPPPVPDLFHYKFDETGTVVTNHASAPPVGTETADILGSTFSQGMPYNDFVSALVADGTVSSDSDYVDTHWITGIFTPWTISFFTSDVPSSSVLYYVFGDITAGGFRCFTNGVAGPGNWILRGTFSDVLVPGGATMAPHMITFVYDPTTSDIKAYLDAVLVNTVPQMGVSIAGAGPLKVGGYSTNVGLNGKMADFRMYTRALTPAEILDIYTYVALETPMTLDIAVDNDVSCNGSNDGSLTVTPTGGIGPYTYLWSNGQTTSTVSNLAPGNYDVTVTDDFGQSATASQAVLEPAAIAFDDTPLPPAYLLAPYMASVGASGGSGALAYAVSEGALPPDLALAPDGVLGGTPTAIGSYAFHVTATDANACSAERAYSLDVSEDPDVIFRDGFEG